MRIVGTDKDRDLAALKASAAWAAEQHSSVLAAKGPGAALIQRLVLGHVATDVLSQFAKLPTYPPPPDDVAERVREVVRAAYKELREAALGAATADPAPAAAPPPPRSMTAACLLAKLLVDALDSRAFGSARLGDESGRHEMRLELAIFLLEALPAGWDDEAAFYPVRAERQLLDSAGASAAERGGGAAARPARLLFAESYVRLFEVLNEQRTALAKELQKQELDELNKQILGLLNPYKAAKAEVAAAAPAAVKEKEKV
ncbi:hypothetical protein MNEG_11938 [Monoraphidium neglectum]|uniref:Uncharacterized protein n=1 Tax=Monoraphidium neglectum TaxID=145388 RepID=A0A0D2MMM5_9CHLO|nr:hypothetical protein MNEG_11938 [Monoraphidium neglectum]KIY96025.1 hypothetical protein MNEG_11938 [Monoraphidium neglectum]|eukprot:XP_013895045.1 hypothetical protein MNEG_11938 [Monoraphidium neglectum]